MEQYDAFSAGVESGGLINTTQIRALICYMIRKLDRPMSGEQLRAILQEEGIANYFDVSMALSDLVKTGIITIDYDEKGNEQLYLTEIGLGALNELVREVPKSVREKALTAGLQAITIARNAEQTKILVEPYGKGYNVTFSVGENDDVLMRLTVYAADQEQVSQMKNHFLKDPAKIYSGILASLIV